MPSPRLLPWLALPAGLALGAWTETARAHSAGQPSGGCAGCHGSGDYDIAVSTSPQGFAPGQQVTVTVTITSPGGAIVGVFVDASTGSLSTISGQGLASINDGLTHTSPKNMSGGSASFAFQWDAPGSPGAVRFAVSTLVGNDNGSSSGDLADFGNFDFVYGCEPFTYFRDADGDGYGQPNNTMINCVGTVPAGYGTQTGDCNDSNQDIFPGATEVCNTIDDDCNGVIDDDAIPLNLYADEDGDGYYSNAEFQMGVMKVGCVPADGYAGYPGDCQPNAAEINPGVAETCNLIDDNCDGRVDEKVRPRCGEGWCTREAQTCDPASCVPGDPVPEKCNLLDDDCDGLVDENAPCDPGLACVGGRCIDAALAPPVPGATDDGMNDGGGCAIGHGSRSILVGAIYVVACAWWVRRRRATARR